MKTSATSGPLVPRRSDRLVAAAFLLPVMVLIAVFVAWPLLSTLRLAFFDVDRRGRVGRFVGWEHVGAVLGSHDFHTSLIATSVFVVLTAPVGIALSLALALLAQRPMRGIGAFRVIFSSTVVTSGALAAGLFIVLLAPVSGAVRYGLQAVHLLGQGETIDLLNDNRWAIVSVAAVTVWANLGFGFILLSAALHSVPESLYEAARLDGCGEWALFRYITAPTIRPMLGFVAVAASLNGILTFGQIDLLTKGGPGGRTDVLAYSLYRRAFRDHDQSSAAVLSMVLIALCLLLGTVQLRFARGRSGSRAI